jgi:nitroreductase
MEFTDVVQRRYSVRAYKSQELTDGQVEKIIEAARLAPSASNRQEWRFIVVRDADKRKKLAAAAHDQGFVGQASAVVVACAVTDGHLMSCGQLCYPIDVAIALEHIALAATDMGLGTCWIGAFDEKAVKQILGVPKEVRVVELMPLGYPADKQHPKTRLALDEILMWDEWKG